MARQAHLIGSIGLEDAETVFISLADILGDCCSRFPDGETGERGYWIRWQQKTFDNCNDLAVENVNVSIPGFKDTMIRPFYKIKEGIDPSSIDLQHDQLLCLKLHLFRLQNYHVKFQDYLN